MTAAQAAARKEETEHGIRILHAQRQSLRQQSARRQQVHRPTSPPRRSTPTSSACTRPGSASITSTRSACCPRPSWCWPTSRRAPSTSGSRPPSTSRRCIIRSASPSNGPRSICSAAAASISPRAAATTRANTRLQGVVRRQPEHLRRRHGGAAEALERGRPPHRPPRQALPVRGRAHHAAADPEAAAGLHRLVLEALDRARRAARLRPDRRAVRRRHELRRPEAGRRPLSRDLRQARQQAAAADVQLLHPFLRQRRSRRRRSAPARSATTRNA